MAAGDDKSVRVGRDVSELDTFSLTALHLSGEKRTPRPIFFCDPGILELICYRTRAKRLINEGSATGGLRKIWTGHATTFYMFEINAEV